MRNEEAWLTSWRFRMRSWTVTILCGAIVVFGASACITGPDRVKGAEPSCINEVVRGEQGSGFLPGCRAYEFVSPGGNPYLSQPGTAEGARASLDGNSILYYSHYAALGVRRSGPIYIAVRGSHGWSAEEAVPQDSPSGATTDNCFQSVFFSADLSQSVLGDGWNAAEEEPGESYCQSSEEALAVGAPAGYGNLYVRQNTGNYQLVNLTPEGTQPANARLQDVSGDFRRVVFSERARLTSEAPSGMDLYEWSAGAVHLISFLPDGTPTPGKVADGGNYPDEEQGVYSGHKYALASATHAVSTDGERVFFYAEHEGSVNLYMRENAMQPQSAINSEGNCTEVANACTTQVDVSHGAGMSGGGVFWDASEDGKRVFFADDRRLTADAGAVTAKPDLYEYNVETGELIDLTPFTGAAANVRGFSGASEDGVSYIYFVAKGVLTSSQRNGEGAAAQSGLPNLYQLHGGALTFIATLNPQADVEAWQETSVSPRESNGLLTTHVSPNGQYVGFDSVNALTGYDNKDAKTGLPDQEIFLYAAVTQQLACVSCVSTSTKPVGFTELPAPMRFADEKVGGAPVYFSRNVLDDGRMFFTTPNGLVPQDTNGFPDVYEYAGGQLHLISSGTSAGSSVFYDASPSGQDVFFVTSQGLVRFDTDNNDSLYDARAEGGFAEPAPPVVCVSEEECRPVAVGSPPLQPPTRAFEGKPSVHGGKPRLRGRQRCGRRRVRRHGRCVRRTRRKRRAKGRQTGR